MTFLELQKLFLLVSLLVIFSHSCVTEAVNITTNIGAIINVESRIGKEQKTAIDVAVRNFNNNSMDHKLFLHFYNSSGDPLLAANAAEELIKKKKVQVIVGMQTSAEAALVGRIASQAQVPVFSFAEGASRRHQWPFMVQMTANFSEQMDCIAAMVHSFNWRRVVVVYEEDMYDGDSGLQPLLAMALQNFGSEIEYQLVLPPFSSLPNPEEFIHAELRKLNDTTKSRAFIVLRSSLPLATILFREAKNMGFMGEESAWIFTDNLAEFLEYADTSFVSSMEGFVGIKVDYSEKSKSIVDFRKHYEQIFHSEYPKEANFKPGIHALRAYDSITVITRALERSSKSNSTSFFDGLLSTNFRGLSGEINFKKERLSHPNTYQVINVFDETYKKVGYWYSGLGFSKTLVEETIRHESDGTGVDLGELKNDFSKWPGNLDRVPKGWAMPTSKNRLRIGVPGRPSFDNFVKTISSKSSADKIYSGFCISVFEELLPYLGYDLPYTFHEFNGTYDELVDSVANKTFDAAVGDVTIIADRWSKVEFTQPFTESGLSMVVPVKPVPKAWIFLKPFTVEMWLASGATLIYTMFVVWFLEHRSNSEFNGKLKDQLGNALWFTFTALFLAHREKIQSNYTRVAVIVWLFVALVLTQSYTANLTSVLTISRLQPNIESLNNANATIGCDKNTFMMTYLNEVLGYKQKNVKPIDKGDGYLRAFENHSITAAVLEIPYAKIFVNSYCKKYTIAGSTYRFGGFGFAFQKGSPIANDVSKAILTLSQQGILKKLEEDLLTPSSECSDSQTPTEDTDSLSIHSFWGLYLFSIVTSSLCCLLFLARLLMNYPRHKSQVGGVDTSNESSWDKTRRIASYLANADTRSSRRDSSLQEVVLET